jgi:hypothetical protein
MNEQCPSLPHVYNMPPHCRILLVELVSYSDCTYMMRISKIQGVSRCHIITVRGEPQLFDDGRGPDSPANSLKTIPLEALNPPWSRLKLFNELIMKEKLIRCVEFISYFYQDRQLICLCVCEIATHYNKHTQNAQARVQLLSIEKENITGKCPNARY